jgi:S1-C subfamily serine protease
MNRTLRGTLAVALAATLLVSGCTSSSQRNATPSVSADASSTPASNNALQAEFVTTIRTVLPSVVLISTGTSLGSGVVFDDKGDIITNAHVVGRSTSFQVTLADSAVTVPATLVGSYPPDDLAVIKIAGVSNLHPATFGDSSKQEVGDIVLAMGNPLGLASSVTNGIISATGRTVTEPVSAGSPGATLTDCLQTSADINPGNSGGALVNLDDQVIGIPTLAAVDQELGGAAPGIGFAIPSNTAKDVASQLIANGKVTNSDRAGLDVTVATVADASGKPVGAGIVSVQPGGPAAKAGLKPGDIIVVVNRVPTPTAEALQAVLATLRPGQTVQVTVQGTDGKTRSATVTLGTV